MDYNKYVMSLDSLDIALLPTQPSRQNNKVAPLWKANNLNLNSDNYFEFNVVNKSDVMESNYDETSNNDNDIIFTLREDMVITYCHICDIELPAAYINDHENSLKHKAYVKIADAVLERTRKHMMKKNCQTVEKNNSMYFCGSCATIVRIVDKSSHDKSKGHKQSLSLDRLLYELVALYTNDFNETDEDATVADLGVNNEVEQQDEFDTNLNNNNTILISDMKACLDKYEMEKVESQGTKVNDVKTPNDCSIKDSTVQSRFFSNSDTFFKMLDVYDVGTEDKVETKPMVNNIDSYGDIKQTGHGTYCCSKCNIILHTNDIESHVNGCKHAWHSKSDLHYLLRQEDGVGDLLCKICNAYIPDDAIQIEQHVATKEHVQKYKNYLKSNYVIQQKENFLCKPCDAQIMNRNELYHIEKMNHEEKLATFKETAGISTIEQNTKVNASTDCSEQSLPKPDSHYCTLCDVFIPNKTYNIKTHYDGARHKKNIGNIANGIDKDGIDSNVNLHYYMEATENEKELKCKACKSIVPNKKENITEHVKGKKHESFVQRILEENQMENLGVEYICALCQHNIRVRDLFSHINTKLHVSLMNDSNQTQVKSEVATISNNTNIMINQQKDENTVVNDKKAESVDNIYMKMKHQFMENKEENQFICKVCNDLNIPNTIIDLVNHATDETHILAYDKLIVENLIFEVENNSYFCGICSCLVPLTGEVYHMRGGRHKGNYTSALSKIECDICNMSLVQNMSNHLISPKHTLRVLKKQALVHFCEYCETLVLKNYVDDHVKICHKLAVKDKICFCTLCDPYLPSCSGTK